MRIAVLGAGGVGGFLGAMLARAGHEVTLLARGAHLDAIRARGLTLESRQFGSFNVRAAATDDPARLGRNDLVIITVKMYDFEEAARTAAAALADDGYAMTVQNGLDAPQILAALVGAERTLSGTIAIEAAIATPGTIAHTTPMHLLVLAQFGGTPRARLKHLESALKEAQINVQLAENGRQALWDKACMLIPFASLTAAGDCTLAEIHGIPALKDVWDTLCDEAIAVANADGYDVRAALESMRSRLAGMASTAPGFTSSMNRDIRSGRRSEVEWLTGKLLRLAGERNVTVPAHATLYGLLKLKEQRNNPPTERLASAPPLDRNTQKPADRRSAGFVLLLNLAPSYSRRALRLNYHRRWWA
jgi:2-dehydropantoate 2-reductase